jgi:hypothetical protein
MHGMGSIMQVQGPPNRWETVTAPAPVLARRAAARGPPAGALRRSSARTSEKKIRHRPLEPGLAGHVPPHQLGNGQDPLPHRHASRKDPGPPAAGRRPPCDGPRRKDTGAPAFRKTPAKPRTARRAAHPREPLAKVAAVQEPSKRSFDASRNAAPVGVSLARAPPGKTLREAPGLRFEGPISGRSRGKPLRRGNRQRLWPEREW